MSSKVAHYKAKKSKLQKRIGRKKAQKAQQVVSGFVPFVPLCGYSVYEQGVVRGLDTGRAEVELLAVKENLNQRRAF